MSKSRRRRETVYRAAFDVLHDLDGINLASLTERINDKVKQHNFSTFAISRLLFPLVAKGLLDSDTRYIEGKRCVVYNLPLQVEWEAWLEA